MTVVCRSRTVPFSCEQMYYLVNDVEHYAEFLPYCMESKVHHRNDDEVQATLVIGAAGMNKSFTTRNLLQMTWSLSLLEEYFLCFWAPFLIR
jgi:ribosome-associated toxin RatA of RatAB toxin-antitoxin module